MGGLCVCILNSHLRVAKRMLTDKIKVMTDWTCLISIICLIYHMSMACTTSIIFDFSVCLVEFKIGRLVNLVKDMEPE